jgi:predicted metal-binding membrane protein
MNVYWIAGLAVIILIEKIAPLGIWISGLFGVALIVWGASLIIHVR